MIQIPDFQRLFYYFSVTFLRWKLMNNPNFVWKRWMIIPFLLPWKMNRNLPNNHYYKIFGVEELVDLPFQVAFVFVILPWPMDALPSLLQWNQSRKVFRRFHYWLISEPAKFSWLVLLKPMTCTMLWDDACPGQPRSLEPSSHRSSRKLLICGFWRRIQECTSDNQVW